jgi:hypothetical protein
VVITGGHFTGAYAVYFDGMAAPSFTVNSDGQITATAQAHAYAAIDVTVATYSALSAINAYDRYSYNSQPPLPSVTGRNPTGGSTVGGTSVVISGSGLTGAFAVYFGAVPATSFTVNSDTSITATDPAQAAGTVDIIVWTYRGSSTTSTSDQFTYTNPAAPVVAGVSPSVGTTGSAVVTITGNRL